VPCRRFEALNGLQEGIDPTGGDFEAAHDALCSEGLTYTKKSNRTATECRVGLAVTGTKGVAVEVNSGTDTVAKNKQPSL
jgi:elongation factor Ts